MMEHRLSILFFLQVTRVAIADTARVKIQVSGLLTPVRSYIPFINRFYSSYFQIPSIKTELHLTCITTRCFLLRKVEVTVSNTLPMADGQGLETVGYFAVYA